MQKSLENWTKCSQICHMLRRVKRRRTVLHHASTPAQQEVMISLSDSTHWNTQLKGRIFLNLQSGRRCYCRHSLGCQRDDTGLCGVDGGGFICLGVGETDLRKKSTVTSRLRINSVQLPALRFSSFINILPTISFNLPSSLTTPSISLYFIFQIMFGLP